MADSPKRLGAIVATVTVATSAAASSGISMILYTVPTSTSAIVSTIFICNRGISAASFRVAHVQNGVVANLTTKDYLYYDIAINGNDTFASTSGISMSAGDSLVVLGSSTDLNFIAEGIEIT